MERKICAVFGESPEELEFGYDEEHYLCTEMKLNLVCAIKMLADDGYRAFCSTAEQGCEMWAAEACLAIKELGGDVRFITAVTAHGCADKWHPERRERYFGILSTCDEVVEPEDPICGLEYIFSVADAAIIQGETDNKRIADYIKTAEEHGLTVYRV